MAKAKKEQGKRTGKGTGGTRTTGARRTRAGTLDFTGVSVTEEPTPSTSATPTGTSEPKGADKLHPIFVRKTLYHLFRTHCAMRGEQMTVVADEVLSNYLATAGIVVPPRPPRANAAKKAPSAS